ncbi:hypothetical protein EON63_24915, partial [archaeon]
AGGGMMAGAYPGLYIFTSPCRVVRPVYNLQLQCVEYVGPLEQVGVCCVCEYLLLIWSVLLCKCVCGICISQAHTIYMYPQNIASFFPLPSGLHAHRHIA